MGTQEKNDNNEKNYYIEVRSISQLSCYSALCITNEEKKTARNYDGEILNYTDEM